MAFPPDFKSKTNKLNSMKSGDGSPVKSRKQAIAILLKAKQADAAKSQSPNDQAMSGLKKAL